jgi:hypothetical protein
MRSKSILYGVNVPISPTSTADAKLTNNITISNVAYPGISEVKNDEEKNNPYVHTSTVNQEVRNTTEGAIKTREVNIESLDSYLLKLYQTILLSDNKKLIANVVLKNSIVLTGEDLEKIIKLKTGKECIINYEDPDTGCCNFNSILLKIASIRIVEERGTSSPRGRFASDETVSDFKIKYNRDYLELITNYQLNLKYILVN